MGGLVVLCDVNTVRRDRHWNALLVHASARGVITDSEPGVRKCKDLSKAPSRVRQHEDRENSMPVPKASRKNYGVDMQNLWTQWYSPQATPTLPLQAPLALPLQAAPAPAESSAWQRLCALA